MGADEILQCPFCMENLKKQYGKISHAEYEAIREAFEDRNFRTVRLFRNVFIEDNGNLNIDVQATCDVCKASWNFKETGIPPTRGKL